MQVHPFVRLGRWLTSSRPAREAYALAIASVLAMAALRAILGMAFDQVVPFGTFFPAVVLGALVGGWGPGFVALAGSALISSLLYLPAGPWAPLGPNDAINLLVFAASGSLIVALGVATRVARADRKEAERVFGVVQEMALDGFVIFRAIRDASGAPIDLERVFMNRAAEKMIGPARELVGQRYLATSPTGARRWLFDRYLKVLETGEPAEDEFLYEDGQRWVYNVAAQIDADRLAITFRDITASKQTINQQNVLLRELNHRVKNVLMMAMSLARLTSAEGSAASYRESLMARIAALGRAHDLLMTESWEGAILDDLIRQTLAPYVGYPSPAMPCPFPRKQQSASIWRSMSLRPMPPSTAHFPRRMAMSRSGAGSTVKIRQTPPLWNGGKKRGRPLSLPGGRAWVPGCSRAGWPPAS